MNLLLLKKPVITEKSLGVASTQNTYTFEVDLKANKQQIRQAIEELYGVEVIKINTTTKNAKTKRTGRKRLYKKVGKVKKALVQLKAGQSIELFDTFKQ